MPAPQPSCATSCGIASAPVQLSATYASTLNHLGASSHTVCNPIPAAAPPHTTESITTAGVPDSTSSPSGATDPAISR